MMRRTSGGGPNRVFVLSARVGGRLDAFLKLLYGFFKDFLQLNTRVVRAASGKPR